LDPDFYEGFEDKLNTEYAWPALYTFKFIVPKSEVDRVKEAFLNHDMKQKPSRKGNFVSCTFQMMANSAQDIIEKYHAVEDIEGIIAL